MEFPKDLDNMELTPSLGELLIAIREVMKMMSQHKEEMSTDKNLENGWQAPPTPLSGQPKSLSLPPEKSMIHKLSQFKKFTPMSFKEAKSPAKAEESLDEPEGVLKC